MLTLQQLTRALRGDISGKQILAPGPGHSPNDRSLSIKIEPSAPDGFLMHSFAGDDPCLKLLREIVRRETAPQPLVPKGKGLTCEKVNEVTYKVTDGECKNVPACHGYWGVYRTTRALAWVIALGCD
jgi:hypothetical protein